MRNNIMYSSDLLLILTICCAVVISPTPITVRHELKMNKVKVC